RGMYAPLARSGGRSSDLSSQPLSRSAAPSSAPCRSPATAGALRPQHGLCFPIRYDAPSARLHAMSTPVRRQQATEPSPPAGTPPRPRRSSYLSFSPPLIGEEEIGEVVDTLRSDWITTGP